MLEHYGLIAVLPFCLLVGCSAVLGIRMGTKKHIITEDKYAEVPEVIPFTVTESAGSIFPQLLCIFVFGFLIYILLISGAIQPDRIRTHTGEYIFFSVVLLLSIVGIFQMFYGILTRKNRSITVSENTLMLNLGRKKKEVLLQQIEDISFRRPLPRFRTPQNPQNIYLSCSADGKEILFQFPVSYPDFRRLLSYFKQHGKWVTVAPDIKSGCRE